MKEPMWFAEALDWAMGRGPARDNIDSVPVAISGQHIAFVYHGDNASTTTPPPAAEPPAATIVSLPTRGVLAEAQLGNCNACEKRDVTRFWKWQESPCEQAPAIEGITPGFRGQPPNVDQGQLPNAVVQITQPPAAPDPVGLAAALNLLGKGDAFRDMSGLPELQQLLSGLASGAVDLVKAQQLAQQVQAKQAAQGGGGSSGGGGAQPRTPEQRYDEHRVLQAQVDDGSLTPEQAEQITLDSWGQGSDAGLDVIQTQGGQALGEAAKKIAETVGSELIGGQVKSWMQDATRDLVGFEGQNHLYPQYPQPAMYTPPGAPRDSSITLTVRLQALRGKGLDGFDGEVQIRWIDNCRLNPKPPPKNATRLDLQALRQLRFKRDITAWIDGETGGNIAKAAVHVTLLRGVDDFLAVPPHVVTSVLITVAIDSKLTGKSKTQSFSISLDDALDPNFGFYERNPLYAITEDAEGRWKLAKVEET